MMDEIDHQYLLSLGFDNARIVDPEKTLRQLRSASDKAQVQLLKATLVAGAATLGVAASNGQPSFSFKRPSSKSLSCRVVVDVSFSIYILISISIIVIS